MSRFRCALVMGALLFPASAHAAAPADFLAAWETSDRLFAESDVVGALNVIEPLIARRGELEPGSPERHWFTYSAGRVLYVVGRVDEADRIRVGEADLPAQNIRPVLTPSAASCPYTGKQYAVEIPGYVGDDWILNGRSKLYGFTWYADRGHFGFTRSYFGGVTSQPKSAGIPSPAIVCDVLPVRQDGAPVGRWPSGGRDYAAAIPATTPLMKTRRVDPRGLFEAQVLAPAGTRTRARAVWVPLGKGAQVRNTLTVRGYSTVVSAPKRRGRYSLQLQMSVPGGQWATVSEVYGVGVGTAPARYPRPKTLGSRESPLDGSGGRGR